MGFDSVEERLSKMSEDAQKEQDKLEEERNEKQTELEVIWSLGNISSDGYIATFHIEDSLVQVMGPFSVIGRSIIVYENEDDLGLVYDQFELHLGFESR